MATITDTEIKQKGIGALVAALGEVNAERFIALLNREPFNYTEWQKGIFSEKSVKDFSKAAMDFRKDAMKE